eukprot:COSAG05_NODE_4415_length_1525_cov_1.206872_2_plen_93_part_01
MIPRVLWVYPECFGAHANVRMTCTLYVRVRLLDTPCRHISREEFAHELKAKAGLEWDAHFSKYFADGCVCEWESLPVLCMQADTHWIREYGRS